MNDTGRLRLYVRIGCSLCEDMLLDLQQLIATEWPGRLEAPQLFDIDEDEQLRARFHAQVPVLMLGEQELCRYYLDPSAVRDAVERELT